MDLYLMQHGQATTETEDPERPLTDTGRDTSPNQSDPAYLFWVFDKQWHTVFKEQLSFEDKRAVSALWDARKEWAHGERISSE